MHRLWLHQLRPDRHGRCKRHQLLRIRASRPRQPTHTVSVPTTLAATRTTRTPPVRRLSAPAGRAEQPDGDGGVQEPDQLWPGKITPNNENGSKSNAVRGSTCTNFAQIATVGSNVTSYSNTGLSRNTTYRYRVRAYNAAGNSGLFQYCECQDASIITVFGEHFRPLIEPYH